MKILRLVLLLLPGIAVSAALHTSNVTVAVYFESHSASSQSFLTGAFNDTLSQPSISSIVDLKLVPYGSSFNFTRNASFICMSDHSADECASEKLELCTLKQKGGGVSGMFQANAVRDAWPFFFCFEGSRSFDWAEMCARRFMSAKDWSAIQKCSSSENQTQEVLEAARKETDGVRLKFQPPFPWVAVNGEAASPSTLQQGICEAYSGKVPDACGGPTPAPAPSPAPVHKVPKHCSMGEVVPCPFNKDFPQTMCAGDECCIDGSTCPSASANYTWCLSGKKVDCLPAADSPGGMPVGRLVLYILLALLAFLLCSAGLLVFAKKWRGRDDNVMERMASPEITCENVLKHEILVSDLKFGEVLGRGGFATVSLAHWQGAKVAAKDFVLTGLSLKQRAALKRSFIRETEVSFDLRSPRVLSVLGICTSVPDHLYIIMELAEGGSVRSMLEALTAPLESERLWALAHDTALGDGKTVSMTCLPGLSNDLVMAPMAFFFMN